MRRLALLTLLLLAISLACSSNSSAPDVPNGTTVCTVPSDFVPVPTGQYTIGGDANEGTVTYADGVINIYDEEGTLVATDNADANEDYGGTTNQRDAQTGVITKVIDIIVCKGHLFIRETVPALAPEAMHNKERDNEHL